MIKIGILGSTGFIGRSLVSYLSRRGFEVHGFCRTTPSEAPIERDNFQQHLIDRRVESSFSKLDWIVCCTGSMLPSDQITYHRLASILEEQNLLIEALKHVRVGVVFVSSGGTVYGASGEKPISEAAPYNPKNAYGHYKVCMEGQVLKISELCRKKVVTARLSNPFGPEQNASKGQGIIARLMHCQRKLEVFELWGDGEAVRDFIHIDDFGDFLIQSIAKEAEGTYNIGSGVGMSVNQVLQVFDELLGPKNKIRVNRKPARDCDVSRIVLDITKAKSELGWQPERDFRLEIANLLK